MEPIVVRPEINHCGDRRVDDSCQIKRLWVAGRRQGYYKLCKSLSAYRRMRRPVTGLKDTDKNKEWQFAALLLSGANLAIYNGGVPSRSCTDLCGIM